MILQLDGIGHRYGDERAVRDVSIGVESGELVGLLGPSGCGKTTLVQAIAGHVRPTTGRVLLRDRDVTEEPPEARRVGLVFQRSTLYPHMTVAENVAYGLAARDVSREERTSRVTEFLDLVGLTDQRDARPSTLSGGQKRRAELARALAPRPDVLLLDEPLSALDRPLRERLRSELARIQRETGVTTLFVTHDQREAMALADRLVVMNDGAIAGTGQPRRLYESPPSPFVASFLGRSNTFAASVLDTAPLTLSISQETLRLSGTNGDWTTGDRVTCHVRPETLSLVPSGRDAAAATLAGEVTRVADVGRRYDVYVSLDTGDDLVVEHAGQPPASGDSVTVGVEDDAVTIFEADGGRD